MVVAFTGYRPEKMPFSEDCKNRQYLECAVPFPGQADFWEEADQRRRYKILVSADKAVVISERYRRGCFFARNRYMIDKADLVVCAFNGQSGGTADTVKYALKHDKVVIQIDPANNIVSLINQGDSNICF